MKIIYLSNESFPNALLSQNDSGFITDITAAPVHADIRFRGFIPGEILKKSGHEIIYLHFLQIEDFSIFKDAIVVINHLYGDALYPLIQKIRAEGSQSILYDLCHYGLVDIPPFGNAAHHYKNLLTLVDQFTFCTPLLETSFCHFFKVTPEKISAGVVDDPLEYPPVAPDFQKNDKNRYNFLWFGNPMNIYNLRTQLHTTLKEISSSIKKFTIITTPSPETEDLFKRMERLYKVPFEILPWSYITLREQLDACDIVYLPVEDNAINRAKTLNRIGSALIRGKPILTTSFYRQILPVFNYGLESTMSDEAVFEHFLSLPEEAINNALLTIQKKFITHKSPAVITEKWAKVFEESAL
ncbi:MAG: hypothetical protein ACTSXQ_02830 [Alphaproteobacteria bacterium]